MPHDVASRRKLRKQSSSGNRCSWEYVYGTYIETLWALPRAHKRDCTAENKDEAWTTHHVRRRVGIAAAVPVHRTIAASVLTDFLSFVEPA